MQEFRRFTEGTLGKVLLAVITLPFVVAGFYGYFAGGAGADQVAKVGDVSITTNALGNEVQSARQQMRQSNPQLDVDLLARFITPQMVLQGMISNALLEQAAADAGMVVSQTAISREIVSAPAFHDDQGKFSEEMFKQQLARLGYTPAGFIAMLQTQTVRNQLQSAFTLTDFALPSELVTQQQLSGQTRDVSYAEVSLAKLAAAVPANEADVKAFYESHKQDYRRPAEVRIQWVEIDPASYHLEITPEQVETEYQAQKQSLEAQAASNEERRVSDIFVAINKDRNADQAKAAAEQLIQQAQQGASFASLASSHSDDPVSAKKGGDLGWLMKDALPDDMGKAVFALAKGAVSAPIKVEDGYHVLKVEDSRNLSIPSLTGMKAEIERNLRQQALLSRTSNDSSKLGDLAYEHQDLVEPAAQLKLAIQTSDWFDPAQPTGFAAAPKVREALQDDAVASRGQNSQLLDLGDNHYAVVHLLDRREATDLPFADVKAKVEQQYRTKQAQDRLAALEEAAGKSADLAAIAAAWNVKVESITGLKRQDARLAADVVTGIFDLPPRSSAKPALLRDQAGNLLAVALTSVRQGEVQAAGEAGLLSQMGAMKGQESFRSYLSWLRSTSEITINEERLKTIN